MKEYMDIGLPDNMELKEFPDYIHISRKWFGTQIIFMTVFALFWDGFLFSFYSGMGDDADLMAKLFPLIHVVVGIGITYYAIAGWFNKSHIFVSKQTIEINHKPLPWYGNKTLKATDMKQLYVKEHVSRNNNSTTVTYQVHAIMTNGKNAKLITGLTTSEQALYIEQEIEKYLNIENAPVKGEVG